MRTEESSKNCLRVKLEIEGSEANHVYKSLKADDEEIEGVEYYSELISNKIVYMFKSCNLLKLRNTIDDVLEKATLAEEVIKGASRVGSGEHRSVG